MGLAAVASRFVGNTSTWGLLVTFLPLPHVINILIIKPAAQGWGQFVHSVCCIQVFYRNTVYAGNCTQEIVNVYEMLGWTGVLSLYTVTTRFNIL